MSLGFGLSLDCSVQQTQTITHQLTIEQSIGETIGDLPLFSLHRISRRLTKHPINLSEDFRDMVARRILRANQEYRERTGNNWNCITPNDLVEAIDGLKIDLEGVAAIGITQSGYQGPELKQLRDQMAASTTALVAATRLWFDLRYDDILYDSKGKIPWFIVQRLRRNLRIWVKGVMPDPFGQGINDFVLEAAKARGIVTEEPEKAWVELGGELFTEEEVVEVDTGSDDWEE